MMFEVHRPVSPFSFFPYLNVRDSSGELRMISGDAVIEGFVARRLGLMGDGEVEDAMCATVAHNAVMLAEPNLTGAGLRGDNEWIVKNVQPLGWSEHSKS